MQIIVLGLVSGVLGLLLIGCAQQQQIEPTEQICLADSEKTQLMQTAQDVLGQMHFAIDKADTEKGYIRTQPLSGAQFFEFWRKDTIGSFNTAEANLHSIRRIVELNIATLENKLCVTCNVNVQRLSLPEEQISTTGPAYRGLNFKSAGAAWLDLGRDSLLETKILKLIQERTQ